MIDHLTLHIPPGDLYDAELASFMRHLGLHEIDNPALHDTREAGYDVRWFASPRKAALPGAPDEPLKPELHLVATDDGERDMFALGHFCVRIGANRYETAKHSKWCVRDSGSGRVWLGFPVGPVRAEAIRVEVRP
jgi:hypothetical protein